MNKTLYTILFLLAAVFAGAGMQVQAQEEGPFFEEGTSVIQGTRIPILTEEQRDELEAGSSNSALKGVFIYNMDTNCEEYWNGEEWISLCGGENGANSWTLGGNSNVTAANNVLGTRSDQPLVIKVNDSLAGFISNTLTFNRNWNAIGLRALSKLPTTTTASGNGDNNAFGHSALRDHTTGEGNVAIGGGALAMHISGNDNTAVGGRSLDRNINGSNNTAIGHNALMGYTGSGNIGIGRESGYNALVKNGNSNIFLGNGPSDSGGFGGNNNRLNIGNVLYGINMYNISTADGTTATAATAGRIGIGTNNPMGVFHVDPLNDNNQSAAPTADQLADDFVITPDGSVGIGTTAPDLSAMLDVTATDKGVLLPRVALTSSTDETTIPNPTTGLLVYNTGMDQNFSTVGYMFWNGTEWRLFASASAETGSAILNCAGADMSPGQQIVGTRAIIDGTVLQIPYSGSNGGSFNGATLTSVGNPAVTATISGGMLAVGSGVLNFELSGTPTAAQQAPNGIKFDLTDFLAVNQGLTGCDEVVVGNTLSASIDETAVMGYLMEMTDEEGAEGFGLQCNSPDGQFSVRVWIPKTAAYTNTTNIISMNGAVPNIQVRNNTNSTIRIIYNEITFYAVDANPLGTNGIIDVPSKTWGGDNYIGGSNYSRWMANSTTGVDGYFGQIGIYDGDGNGPEYRRYTWIPIGNNQKTSYEIRVMAAIDNISNPTATTPSGTPTQIKAYIKFEQVTAM